MSQWLTNVREQGPEALRAQPHPGHPPRLSLEQQAQLPKLLAEGPEAYGFHGQRWTRRRVAEVIRRHYGVHYSVWQVGRILRRLRHSPQKPVVRAAQRKQDAIEAWQRATLPAIPKKGGRRGPPARVR